MMDRLMSTGIAEWPSGNHLQRSVETMESLNWSGLEFDKGDIHFASCVRTGHRDLMPLHVSQYGGATNELPLPLDLIT